MAFDNNPHDDDFDGLPGSDESSPAYDRRFNRDGYNELTNLPEIDERQEIAQFERQLGYRRHQQGLREAMKRVQYWPHVGRFIIPRENTYAAHLALVREGETVDIQFDPKTYLHFDKVIAEHASKPALFNPRHRDYDKYKALRENLAVLRNDLMGDYMNDGSFNPGDEKYLPLLTQIAAEIGDALNADNRWKKVVFPSIDTETANLEGEGAAYMYEYILKRQVGSGWRGNLWGGIRRILGQPDHQWGLAPIEMTAFSAEALMKPPPSDDELCTSCSHAALHQRAAEQAEQQLKEVDPTDTHLIRDVSSPERREAVKHGKKIIEWLKNIQFSDKSLQDFVDAGRPGEENPERDAMNLMIDAYYQVMDTAIRSKPSLFDHEQVQAANEALTTLEHGIALMAKLENPHSQEDAMDINTDIANQPERWGELSKETVERLMARLKAGLEEAVAEIVLQQQEADLAQEAFAEQQVEEALAMQRSYAAKRARKQKGVTQQQRIDRALRADDRAAGQGIYANDDDEDAVRIARQKSKTDQSMQQQIARAQAMKHDLAGKQVVDKKPINNELVKQLGKTIMHMQQQANVAASEVADVKGGGIGTGETFKDRQDPNTNFKHKPQIG